MVIIIDADTGETTSDNTQAIGTRHPEHVLREQVYPKRSFVFREDNAKEAVGRNGKNDSSG